MKRKIPVSKTSLVYTVLTELGYTFTLAQRQYLVCLMLEHVAKLKESGQLLADVEFSDLRHSYRRHLASKFAPKVSKMTELW